MGGIDLIGAPQCRRDAGIDMNDPSLRLSVEEMQGWIIHIYPFIYDFPKFLAEALIKVEDDFSRTFLIENIRIEKAHAEHWLWMGEGFGLDRQRMLDLAEGGTDRKSTRLNSSH